MIKKCKVCQKEFVTYPSKIALGRGVYCSKKCCLLVTAKNILGKNHLKKGKRPANYKGRLFQTSRKGGKQYVLLHMPKHPFCTKKGYIREHRFVAEKKIGRYLTNKEIVHHLNGDSLDNRPENLEVMLKIEHDRMNVHLNVHKRWQKK